MTGCVKVSLDKRLFSLISPSSGMLCLLLTYRQIPLPNELTVGSPKSFRDAAANFGLLISALNSSLGKN